MALLISTLLVGVAHATTFQLDNGDIYAYSQAKPWSSPGGFMTQTGLNVTVNTDITGAYVDPWESYGSIAATGMGTDTVTVGQSGSAWASSFGTVAGGFDCRYGTRGTYTGTGYSNAMAFSFLPEAGENVGDLLTVTVRAVFDGHIAHNASTGRTSAALNVFSYVNGAQPGGSYLGQSNRLFANGSSQYATYAYDNSTSFGAVIGDEFALRWGNDIDTYAAGTGSGEAWQDNFFLEITVEWNGPPQQVPEPTTALLLLAACAGGAVVKRRLGL